MKGNINKSSLTPEPGTDVQSILANLTILTISTK